MTKRTSYHMSPDEFRKRGREVVDWIAGYLERLEELPVMSRVEPGQICGALPEHPPERGEPFESVMKDLDEIILPGVTHWQSPSFFAFFPANASGPAMLGELLSAGLGVQGMMWITSPACTELETRVLDWLVEMLGLPRRFLSTEAGGGVIQDTASSASLCALLAARERATSLASNREGVRRPLMAYGSTEVHSSVEKAVRIAGIGSDNLRSVEVDDTFAIRPEALAQAMEEDRKAGRIPFFVTATVGTTSSNAMDHLPPVAEVCRKYGAWLHVDAAMSGTAALCPEFRSMLDGVEGADSFCFNPHKWMFTNFDCDCFWVADREALIRALTILPEYLRNPASESAEVFDYRDWQVPLGRRFRALKLWMVIRHYGVEGLRHHVRRHVELARELAGWIEADPDFELVARPPLNLVCFRHRGGDEVNRRLVDAANATGRIYLNTTRLNGLLTIRMSVGGIWTERRHVEEAWRLLRSSVPAK